MKMFLPLAMMAALNSGPSSASPPPCPGQAVAPWITLGTAGGPLPQADRRQPANALIVNGAVYVFDTGDGVVPAMAAAGLAPGAIRAVFITHHHVDHNAGLGSLLVNRWLLRNYRSIPIWGPRGTARMVDGLLAANLATERAPVTAGSPSPALTKTAKGYDIDPARTDSLPIYQDENIRVVAVANAHYHFARGTREARFARSYSYRIETGGRTIFLTGDTGPSEAVTRLAAGADLLVSEVIDPDETRRVLTGLPGMSAAALDALMAHMREDHLTADDVGQLARGAAVKCVVLSHLPPRPAGSVEPPPYVQGVSGRYAGPVILARDGGRY